MRVLDALHHTPLNRCLSRYCAKVLLLAAVLAPRAAHSAELAFRTQEIGAGLGVGYAVAVVDMNDDRRADVVIGDHSTRRPAAPCSGFRVPHKPMGDGPCTPSPKNR